MKLLIFQLRRPFRSGYLFNAQNRTVSALLGNRASGFDRNMDISIEEMDQYWYLQNQKKAVVEKA
jgi:hypothetical protein